MITYDELIQIGYELANKRQRLANAELSLDIAMNEVYYRLRKDGVGVGESERMAKTHEDVVRLKGSIIDLAYERDLAEYHRKAMVLQFMRETNNLGNGDFTEV